MEDYKKALLVLDYINEIVHEEGKLAKKGYHNYMIENGVDKNLKELIQHFRNSSLPIIYIKLGFDKNYAELPTHSVLLGKAKEFGILKLGSWDTEIYELFKPNKTDTILSKSRISPFYNTGLEEILKELGIEELYVAGVSTDLVVQSAARDGHDRNYKVNIVDDCCTAATSEEHKLAIENMKKFSNVINLDDIIN